MGVRATPIAEAMLALVLMDHLGHERFHLVGNSLGGLVVWWMMADAPERLLSVTLAGPGSPFGFGGTRDASGTPTTADFAGSGGGLMAEQGGVHLIHCDFTDNASAAFGFQGGGHGQIENRQQVGHELVGGLEADGQPRGGNVRGPVARFHEPGNLQSIIRVDDHIQGRIGDSAYHIQGTSGGQGRGGGGAGSLAGRRP